jgi:zinc transport system substrate-binding protein
MKSWRWVLASSICLIGCSGGDGAVEAGRPQGTGRPLVYAANYPLQYFAERISTPLVDVRLPVPAGEDPAFWHPEPEDVLELQQADLILLNGASYESWLAGVSLSTSKLVDSSAAFRDRLIAREEATTHSHGPDGEHEHSATAFTTWLDPTLAVEQARAIAGAFSARWPQHEDQFTAQLARLVTDLEAWDAEIAQLVRRNPSVPVVFSHPVYQYLERRYDLKGRSVHWEPHEMPSDSMWEELVALLSSHSAEWMIWEGEPSADIAGRLLELGIRSVVFDPCGDLPEGDDFAVSMQRNLEALGAVYRRP